MAVTHQSGPPTMHGQDESGRVAPPAETSPSAYQPPLPIQTPPPIPSRRDTSASLGLSLEYYLSTASPTGSGPGTPIDNLLGGFEGSFDRSERGKEHAPYITLDEDEEELLDDKELRALMSGSGMSSTPVSPSPKTSHLREPATHLSSNPSHSHLTPSDTSAPSTQHPNQANIHRRMHVLDIPPTPSTIQSSLNSANNSTSDLGMDSPAISPMEEVSYDPGTSEGRFVAGGKGKGMLSIPIKSGSGSNRFPPSSRRDRDGNEDNDNSSASEYSVHASPITPGPFAVLERSAGTGPGRDSDRVIDGYGRAQIELDEEEVEIMRERQRIVALESSPRLSESDEEVHEKSRSKSGSVERGTTEPLALRTTGGSSGSEPIAPAVVASGATSASGSTYTSGSESSSARRSRADADPNKAGSPYSHVNAPLPTIQIPHFDPSSFASASHGLAGKIPKASRLAFMAPPDVSPGSLDRVEQAIQISAEDYIGGGGSQGSRGTEGRYKRLSERTAKDKSGSRGHAGTEQEDRERARSAPAWKAEFSEGLTRSDDVVLNSPNLQIQTGKMEPLKGGDESPPLPTASSRSKGRSGKSSPIEHPFFNMRMTSPPMVKQTSATFTDQTATSETAGPVLMGLTRESSKRIRSPRKASQPMTIAEDSDSFAASESTSPSLQSMSSFGASNASLDAAVVRPSIGVDNLPSRSSSQSIPSLRLQKGSSSRPEMQEPMSSYSSRSSLGIGNGASGLARSPSEQITAKLEHSMQRFSVQTLRRPASLRSLRSQSSIDIAGKRAAITTVNRPWPAAMLFGNIKALRAPGARADAYAKAVNDLNAADSGLRSWQEVAGRKSKAPIAPSNRKRAKLKPMSELGARSSSVASPRPDSYSPTIRNLSGGSDVFPMRPDATVAKEITVQLVDPANPPDALPANLPYPQLQVVAQASGMKPSPSMSSVKSSSGGGGFSLFSKVGRLTGSKKAKELAAYSNNLSPVIDSPKRQSIDSFDRQTAIPSPAGPRDRTSFSSQDRRSSFRSSIDKPRQRNSMTSQGPIVKAAISAPTPLRKEDISRLSEVLPAANPAVLEAYLKREGDQMQAIGAYIEDEKAGRLMAASNGA